VVERGAQPQLEVPPRWCLTDSSIPLVGYTGSSRLSLLDRARARLERHSTTAAALVGRSSQVRGG
jgi:hypothetical protein